MGLEKQLYQQAVPTGVSLVLYDLTSVYFEGDGPPGISQYGHSRDHRSDRPQVLLAVAADACGAPAKSYDARSPPAHDAGARSGCIVDAVDKRRRWPCPIQNDRRLCGWLAPPNSKAVCFPSAHSLDAGLASQPSNCCASVPASATIAGLQLGANPGQRGIDLLREKPVAVGGGKEAAGEAGGGKEFRLGGENGQAHNLAGDKANIIRLPL